MKVLAFLAPQEGVGRTTLVAGLAAEAERNGAGPVVLIDAEPAGEHCRRAAAAGEGPMTVAWDASCRGAGLDRLGDAGVGLVIVDAPLAPCDVLMQTLERADLAVVVIRPNERDFSNLGPILDAVGRAGKPLTFVVNRAPEGGLLATATAIALSQYGPVCPVVPPERPELAGGPDSLAARTSGRRCLWPAQAKRPDADLARLWGYLNDRLAAAAAAKDGHERRRFARHAFDTAATFTWEGQVFPCRLRDISAGGLSLRSSVPLPIGARLLLHIPYLGEFEAEPVRAEGAVAGLRFILDEWRQAELVRDLRRLVNAGRQPLGGPAEPLPETGVV